MPTVIDSLTVELRLDTSQFERGRKDAAENLEQTKRKVDDQSRGVNDSLGKMSESFLGVAKSALEMYGVILSTQAIKRFTEDTTRANSSLGRLGQNLATSPAQIYAWGRAAERLGGSADATVQSFQSLGDQIEAFKTQGQQLPLAFYQIEALGGKQVDLNHSVAQTFSDIAENLHRIYQIDPQKADFLGRQLGIDAGTVNLMERYGAGIAKISDQIATMAPTQEQIDRSQKLQESWAKLAASSDLFGRTLVDSITPALTYAADETTKLMDAINKGAKANDYSLPTLLGNLFGFKIPEHGLLGPQGSISLPSGAGGTSQSQADFIRQQMRGGTPFAPNTQPSFGTIAGGIPSTVEGRPVSRANPVPVTIADGGGQSGGGFWSKVGDAVSSWLGGGPAHASVPPSGGVSALPLGGALARRGASGFPSGASPAVGGANPTDLTAQLMTDYGLTREQALGAVGVMGYESGDFKTMQEVGQPPGSGGWGWAQWTGPRRKAFMDYATANGLDPSSKEANYGFLQHELATDYAGVIPIMKQQKTVDDAAYAWERNFEGMTEGGPGIPAFAGHQAKARAYDRVVPADPIAAAQRAQGAGWALDWGHTSAAARAALAGSQSVTTTTSSTDINIGHIDLHTNATDGQGLATDFARTLRQQSDAQMANYGAM